jgi:hypothetical protein
MKQKFMKTVFPIIFVFGNRCSDINYKFAFQFKKMKNLIQLILLASVVVFFSACENDIELNAPYKETTIIFGVLDASADTQFIRINKTFLGEGNALDMALVKDSSEYDPATVSAYLLKDDETPSEENKLQYKIIPQREPGVFYDQNVIVYYSTRPLPAVTDNEFETVIYHIEVRIGDKVVKASTGLVGMSFTKIKKPSGNSEIDYSQAGGIILMSSDNYRDVDIEINTPINAKRFEASYIFNYREQYIDGTFLNKSIVYNTAVKKSQNPGVSEILDFPVNSESLFRTIGESTIENENVKNRAILSLEANITICAEDLNTYIDINQPISGIVTERPVFTNVENGIGIFSSKYTVRKVKTIGGSATNRNDTYKQFQEGIYTSGLCYCDTLPGTTYNCGAIQSCN